MTACNARPPADHPFHGSGVACHMAAGHVAPHTWEIRPGPWMAVFVDGPCLYEERIFVVGPIWERIEFASIPGRPARWAIVGGDQIGSNVPPWPDQVTYQLRKVDDGDVHGEPGQLAYYEFTP